MRVDESPDAASFVVPARLRRCSGNVTVVVLGNPLASGVVLIPLLRSLVRPYRSSLFLVLFAMLVQTLMSLAAPWPLKIILDNVVGSHKLPHRGWTMS